MMMNEKLYEKVFDLTFKTKELSYADFLVFHLLYFDHRLLYVRSIEVYKKDIEDNYKIPLNVFSESWLRLLKKKILKIDPLAPCMMFNRTSENSPPKPNLHEKFFRWR